MESDIKYGCNQNGPEQFKDDDSLIEKCWTPAYKGDSRKWIIRDGSYVNPKEAPCSTMKATYKPPQKEDSSMIQGQRKMLLLKKFEEEAIAEVIKEQSKPPIIEEYCSTYDGTFNMQGFQPDIEAFKKKTELYEKYPLYSSAPTSYYSYNLKKRPKEILHGLTYSANPVNPFKKCAGFTKPLSDTFDNHYW